MFIYLHFKNINISHTRKIEKNKIAQGRKSFKIFMEVEKLIELAEEKVNLGNDLVNNLKNLENIDGIKKLQRKIIQEVKFLEKVCRWQ